MRMLRRFFDIRFPFSRIPRESIPAKMNAPQYPQPDVLSRETTTGPSEIDGFGALVYQFTPAAFENLSWAV